LLRGTGSIFFSPALITVPVPVVAAELDKVWSIGLRWVIAVVFGVVGIDGGTFDMIRTDGGASCPLFPGTYAPV